MSPRIAVGAKYLANRPIAEVVAAARSCGADGLELAERHLARALEAVDDASADPVGLCADAGVKLVGAKLADLSPGPGADDLAEPVSVLCEQIGAASRIGLPSLSFSTGRRDTLSMDAVVRAVRRLLPVAEASGVRVWAANRSGSRLEQIEDLRRFVAMLRHPALRLRIDTGEFHAAAVNPRDVLAEFGDVTGAVVLSDWRGRDEVPIGQGRVNLSGIVADLLRADYDGWLVVNVRGGAEAAHANPIQRVREMIAAGAGE